METPDNRCTRLGSELQDAYDEWVRKSEACRGGGSLAAPPDISGCSEAARLEWFAYLAARQRLVYAYAERTEAAGNDR
jgi:hypothetical protein